MEYYGDTLLSIGAIDFVYKGIIDQYYNNIYQATEQ